MGLLRVKDMSLDYEMLEMVMTHIGYRALLGAAGRKTFGVAFLLLSASFLFSSHCFLFDSFNCFKRFSAI